MQFFLHGLDIVSLGLNIFSIFDFTFGQGFFALHFHDVFTVDHRVEPTCVFFSLLIFFMLINFLFELLDLIHDTEFLCKLTVNFFKLLTFPFIVGLSFFYKINTDQSTIMLFHLIKLWASKLTCQRLDWTSTNLQDCTRMILVFFDPLVKLVHLFDVLFFMETQIIPHLDIRSHHVFAFGTFRWSTFAQNVVNFKKEVVTKFFSFHNFITFPFIAFESKQWAFGLAYAGIIETGFLIICINALMIDKMLSIFLNPRLLSSDAFYDRMETLVPWMWLSNLESIEQVAVNVPKLFWMLLEEAFFQDVFEEQPLWSAHGIVLPEALSSSK